MPTYIWAVIFYYCAEAIPNLQEIILSSPLAENTVSDLRLVFLVGIFAVSFLIPGLLILYLYKSKIIDSLTLHHRKSRNLPYLLTGIIYVLYGVFFIQKMEQTKAIGVSLMSIGMSILVLYLINLKWKISAHATGLAGAIGIFFGITLVRQTDQLYWIILLTLIITSAVLSARLRLNAHTPAQILAGLLLGFIFGFITILFI